MAEAFPKIKTIRYEGADSRNPLSFKHYNPDEMVEGKTMRDHLRFASCFWHTMRGRGGEIFGMPTAVRPWDDFQESVDTSIRRIEVFFELLEKLQIDYYCFHDRDVAPEGRNLKESNKILDRITKVLAKAQKNSGKKLLWGTACLFQHPRFMHGAATSPNLDAFIYAAAQVKKVLEVTHELGGEGYFFWGGREGYFTLLNTDMKRELDHLGAFMHIA
ncbi:MAG: xylose isomerase, partial [Acidobacteriota bacterium]